MDKISIEPTKSVNGIKFYTGREKVRADLNTAYTEFKKSKFSKNTTDDYKLFHIFYDNDNNFQAIEFFADVRVIVGDIDIFSLKATDLHLLSMDFIEEYGSYVSKENSIGITFENGKIASILFGCSNYYE